MDYRHKIRPQSLAQPIVERARPHQRNRYAISLLSNSLLCGTGEPGVRGRNCGAVSFISADSCEMPAAMLVALDVTKDYVKFRITCITGPLLIRPTLQDCEPMLELALEWLHSVWTSQTREWARESPQIGAELGRRLQRHSCGPWRVPRARLAPCDVGHGGPSGSPARRHKVGLPSCVKNWCHAAVTEYRQRSEWRGTSVISDAIVRICDACGEAVDPHGQLCLRRLAGNLPLVAWQPSEVEQWYHTGFAFWKTQLVFPVQPSWENLVGKNTLQPVGIEPTTSRMQVNSTTGHLRPYTTCRGIWYRVAHGTLIAVSLRVDLDNTLLRISEVLAGTRIDLCHIAGELRSRAEPSRHTHQRLLAASVRRVATQRSAGSSCPVPAYVKLSPVSLPRFLTLDAQLHSPLKSRMDSVGTPRPSSRSEEAIRATLARTPSPASLLRARRTQCFRRNAVLCKLDLEQWGLLHDLQMFQMSAISGKTSSATLEIRTMNVDTVSKGEDPQAVTIASFMATRVRGYVAYTVSHAGATLHLDGNVAVHRSAGRSSRHLGRVGGQLARCFPAKWYGNIHLSPFRQRRMAPQVLWQTYRATLLTEEYRLLARHNEGIFIGPNVTRCACSQLTPRDKGRRQVAPLSCPVCLAWPGRRGRPAGWLPLDLDITALLRILIALLRSTDTARHRPKARHLPISHISYTSSTHLPRRPSASSPSPLKVAVSGTVPKTYFHKRGRGGVVARLLISYQGKKPSPIPGGVATSSLPTVFVRGNRNRNRAGRCRWLSSFPGDLPFPSTLHSGVTPYSEPPKSLNFTLNSRDQFSALAKLAGPGTFTLPHVRCRRAVIRRPRREGARRVPAGSGLCRASLSSAARRDAMRRDGRAPPGSHTRPRVAAPTLPRACVTYLLLAHRPGNHSAINGTSPPPHTLPSYCSPPPPYIHTTVGATVAEWLACSPPTKANWVQSPAGSSDFRKWESCQTMPVVGEFFSGISRFPRPFIPAHGPYSPLPPSSNPKTTML
ncbi:hypothetical protein PR048_021559 [Dryococelus australis]|uniref:Uncharacterized protein n=1 Tax=Dryococelus australis TaxID=614101 RepID=A0ABQ9GYM4_9NEOP|nr:hypothetical protein PR048_021559 [Dryococelus australis]